MTAPGNSFLNALAANLLQAQGHRRLRPSWLLAIVLCLGLCTGSGAQVDPFTVCLDPGHSKKTVGTQGRNIKEYEVAWQVAEKLKRLLEQKGVVVVMTKATADTEVSNAERARIANRCKAQLFLRLHCDAGAGRGTATYYPAKQGVDGDIRGPAPSVLERSREIAAPFHAARIKALHGKLADNGVRTDMQTAVGKQHGGALVGSIHAQVPVLLVEMCVLQNRQEERLIASPQGQMLMAQSLAEGVFAVQKLMDSQTKKNMPEKNIN